MQRPDARRRQSLKRGGDPRRVPMDDVVPIFEERSADLVALDEALVRLSERNDRRARVVELRFFGGLTVEETADFLETSIATVKRDWHVARLWLLTEMGLE